jgi:hypothetical protein
MIRIQAYFMRTHVAAGAPVERHSDGKVHWQQAGE